MEELEPFYDYYNRELTYLRHQGIQFAHKYPKIAQKLDFTLQESSDPHVERLLESFAYLTARLQRDIDDQFPRLTHALLTLLYPQFANPLPSLSIAEFIASPQKGKLTGPYTIPKDTPLFINSQEDETCRFQTCFPLQLVPCEVLGVEIVNPFNEGSLSTYIRTPRALKMHIKSFGESFKGMPLQSLRFFLEGSRFLKNSLYEGLFAQEADIALVLGNYFSPLATYSLPSGSLYPVGFNESETVIPYPGQGHPGYRLLFEYFHFPEKFYFFDVKNLFFPYDTKEITIFISLAPDFSIKAEEISTSNFRLNCTPIINLFKKISEPIHLDHKAHEYRLVADLKHEKTVEVHSIQEVKSAPNGSSHFTTYNPYFSYHHSLSENQKFWIARRVPSLNPHLGGTDTFLSFIDAHMDPFQMTYETAFAHILCTNRTLAQEISMGAVLSPEQENPAAKIICLMRPTAQYYPATEGASQWRIISHLSLNHLSLSNNKESLMSLKEMIELYTDHQKVGAAFEIEAILKMETHPVMRRFGKEAWRGFVAGTHIRLSFDSSKNPQKNLFLFTSVLNHFFSLFSAVNSFTELELFNLSHKGVWKKWPPIAGSKALL